MSIWYTTLLFIYSISYCSYEYILNTPFALSEDMYTHIFNCIQKDFSLIQLKSNFPFIKDVAHKKTHHKTIVTLHISEPLYSINNEWYVTYQGYIYNKSTIRSEIYDRLPCIYLGNSKYYTNHLGAYLVQIPEKLFQDYIITFYSPYKIILQSKKNKWWPIITTLEKCITSQLEEYIIYIHKKFYDTYFKKKKKKYALDIRFEKQIVLQPIE